ncbi:MAG TPA: Lrp/AsnC family transcriptional regulator [Luteimicrobium sp.]|uniref:Lrp/AsnC family transcriptional regulator n=1 Tax=Isoptericola variabilis TaxID=139208 RepID=UPI002C75CF6A|nr:Lrp/AsnC family transcriptional regulator [Luteimicrobium sp.]HWV79083.1 Lrp/AsnC family transcriptional regulator [Isoptericola sp.]
MSEGTLDDVDRALVRALREDGRATLAALAGVTGLSQSAVQARVRKLEARRVITGYRAVVDPDAVGLPIAAYVEITPLDQSQADDAPERLRDVPGIEACWSVAGNANYLLLVRVSSPSALEDLLGEIRREASVSTRSTVVLRTYFEGRPLAH